MYVGTYVLIRLGICLSSLVMKEGKCTVHTCIQFHVHTYTTYVRTYVSLLLVEPHYLRIPTYVSSWFVCSSREVWCVVEISALSAGGQTTTFLYLICVCTEVHCILGGSQLNVFIQH